MDTELSRTAYHESGHAIGISVAFCDAQWLPRQRPEVLVRSVAITESAPGQFLGNCTGMNIYSTKWPEWYRIAPRYLDLMKAQALMAGGLAEAIHRGERRRHQVLAFAKAHCHLDEDMALAAGVLAHLHRLGAYDEQSSLTGRWRCC